MQFRKRMSKLYKVYISLLDVSPKIGSSTNDESFNCN